MVTDEHRPGGSGDKDAREATRKGAAAGAKTPAKSAPHPYTTAQRRPAAKGGTKVRVSVAAGSGLADESQEQKKRLGTARRSAFFLLLVAVAYVLYLILSGQMDVFLASLAEVDPYWVFAGMLAYVVYFILGVSAYVLALAVAAKMHFYLR